MTNTGGIVADECTKNSVSHKKCIGCPANCCSYTCTKQSDVLMHTIYRPNDRSLFNNVNIWMDWSNKPTGHELVYVVTYNWCLIHTYTYAFKSATILCFTFKTYITVTKSLHTHTATHVHIYVYITIGEESTAEQFLSTVTVPISVYMYLIFAFCIVSVWTPWEHSVI